MRMIWHDSHTALDVLLRVLDADGLLIALELRFYPGNEEK